MLFKLPSLTKIAIYFVASVAQSLTVGIYDSTFRSFAPRISSIFDNSLSREG